MQVDSDAAAARPTGLAGNGSKVCARVRGLAKNGSKEVCLCTRVCLRVNKRQKNTFASPSRHYHIKDSFMVLFFSLSFSPIPVLLELELT